ncbi:MAG: alpha/beta hydrolase-fold protein [Flavobacteriaceae bacterium]
MRILVILLFLFSFSSTFGQKTIYKEYESEELKDIRDVSIYLPKSYNKDSISNFPLAIVLDGHKLFDLYVGTSNYYASQDNAPEQIVVGVNMEETRNKDAAFDVTNSNLTSDSKRFYRFLRDELIPFIEANYKTSPFITIVGESLTGNFITHFLKEKEPIFNAYICLNPTLAVDINKQMQSYKLERFGTVDNTFYFYLSGNPYAKGQQLSKIKTFGKFMTSVSIDNFNVVFDELSSSPSSSSVIGEGMSRAFAKVFEIYSGITAEEYDTKIKNLSPPDAITYLEIKYLDIEFLFGSNIGIRQRDVIAIEDIILDKENGDYLDDFGKMILKLYPTSEMGHYYLGRYYESGKDYTAALEQYRLGYGKMNPADPNADLFYQNVERLLDNRD